MSEPPRGIPEIEIKLRLSSADDGHRRLVQAGFILQEPRALESNTLYDDAGQGLRRRGELVRIRRFAGRVVLTYKGRGGEQPGKVAGSRHKHRPELETAVADEAPLAAVLTAAGLIPVRRYEKYRSVYGRAGDPGLALLDETPLGEYLELEGTPEWIDRVAAELGFGVADYITRSYLSLHQEEMSKRGCGAADMTFDAYREGAGQTRD